MSFLRKAGSAFLYIGKEVFEVLKDKTEQAKKIQKSSDQELKKMVDDRRTTRFDKMYAENLIKRRQLEKKEREEEEKRKAAEEDAAIDKMIDKWLTEDRRQK